MEMDLQAVNLNSSPTRKRDFSRNNPRDGNNSHNGDINVNNNEHGSTKHIENIISDPSICEQGVPSDASPSLCQNRSDLENNCTPPTSFSSAGHTFSSLKSVLSTNSSVSPQIAGASTASYSSVGDRMNDFSQLQAHIKPTTSSNNISMSAKTQLSNQPSSSSTSSGAINHTYSQSQGYSQLPSTTYYSSARNSHPLLSDTSLHRGGLIDIANIHQQCTQKDGKNILNLECDAVDVSEGMKFKAARLLSPLKGDTWRRGGQFDNNIDDDLLISMMTQIETRPCTKFSDDSLRMDMTKKIEVKQNLQHSEDDLLIAMMDQIENKHDTKLLNTSVKIINGKDYKSNGDHDFREVIEVPAMTGTEHDYGNNVKLIDYRGDKVLIDNSQMEITTEENDFVFNYNEEDADMAITNSDKESPEGPEALNHAQSSLLSPPVGIIFNQIV